MMGISLQKCLFGIAALAALLGVTFAAAPAQAQCADVFDTCEIADDLLDWYYEEFGDFFTLPEEDCDKLAQKYYDQCVSAVKLAKKCWNSQIADIGSTAKTACKTEGEDSDDCKAYFKDRTNGWRDETASDSENEIFCCEDRAEEFWFTCVEGF